MSKTSVVFVIDKDGKPLLPTNPVRARRLLKSGKAKVKQVVPFTIQLQRVVVDPVGSFVVGVDDGAKHVGFAIKNTLTDEVVFRGTMDHRQDVKRKVKQRADYRRARRFRLRNRKPRFSNRTRKGWIAPSIRQRKEAIVRVVCDMQKRLNIVAAKVEEVKFDHFTKSWGKFFSLVEIGKKFLKQQIEALGLNYEVTWGYETKPMRIGLGLPKTHSGDACAIVGSNNLTDRDWTIKPRRTKIWENNPTKTCEEKNGFRHYDLVVAQHRTKGRVVGSIVSLKKIHITLRTLFSKSFPVGYTKSKLLQRFKGLIYSYG